MEKEQLEVLRDIASDKHSLGAFCGMIFNASLEHPKESVEALLGKAVAVRLKVMDLAATIPEEEVPARPKRLSETLPVSKGRDGGYPIVCSICGKNDTVPFKPKWENALYCKECFAEKKRKELEAAAAEYEEEEWSA